jgi:peptidoglycan/LPS O-acetylase OafA/YrhL
MRVNVLDLVRFFAAFAVVLYHYTARSDSTAFPILSEFTKYGYLGVPLFFMISGYVISLSAQNRSAMQFAASRFVRLYPAYWAGIAVTCLLVAATGDFHYGIAQIAANATMLNDYLGVENIDGVYWTLQAELKFYACIFLLIFFNLFNNFKGWLSIWLAITALYLFTGQPFFMGSFISPEYSSFFIAGTGFFLLQKYGKNLYTQAVLLLSMLISSYYTFSQADEFLSSPSALSRGIAVVLVWSFYYVLFLIATDRLTIAPRRIYATLGGLTYPLYLIHSVAGKAIIDRLKNITSEQIAVLATTIVMLAISYLIHVGIEKRFSTPLKNLIFSTLEKLPHLPRFE